MNNSNTVSRDFNPTVWHPFFFVRRGIYSFVKEKAPLCSGRLLDFGCGSKPYQSLFNVQEYIGVDFENEGHPHLNEYIDFLYDGKKIPFNNDYFDCVLCSEVFEHLFEPDSLLKELNRVLKSGGIMLLTCPFIWDEHEIPYDYARYTHFSLKYLMEKNDFEVIELNKKGNVTETITQLKILRFRKSVWNNITKLPFIGTFLIRVFYFYFNCRGLLSKSLRVDQRGFYLTNTILVRKR